MDHRVRGVPVSPGLTSISLNILHNDHLAALVFTAADKCVTTCQQPPPPGVHSTAENLHRGHGTGDGREEAGCWQNEICNYRK